jgi:hypothetical protein
MAYFIETKTEEHVLLKRKSFKGKFFIFFTLWSFAIPGILIFIISLAGSGSEEDLKFRFVSLAFASIGILGIYSFSYYLKLQKILLPEAILFDNKHGWIKMEQDKKSNQTAYIPYNELEKFDIRKQNSVNNSQRKLSYFVVLKKKDGGSIDLICEYTEAAIASQLEELKKYVNFNIDSIEIPQVTLSPKILKEIKNEKTYLRWNNPAKKNIKNLFMSSVLVYLVIISFLEISILSHAHLIAQILIVIMLAGVTISILYRGFILYKDITNTFGICLGKSSLEYFEENKSGKINFSLPVTINELHGIVFNFTNQATEPFLQVETKEEFKLKKERENELLSFDNFKRSIGITTGKIILNTRSLNTIEKIQLENCIQKVIKERSGIGKF